MIENNLTPPNNQPSTNSNQTNNPTPSNSSNQKPQEPIVKNNNDERPVAFDWKPTETKSTG